MQKWPPPIGDDAHVEINANPQPYVNGLSLRLMQLKQKHNWTLGAVSDVKDLLSELGHAWVGNMGSGKKIRDNLFKEASISEDLYLTYRICKCEKFLYWDEFVDAEECSECGRLVGESWAVRYLNVKKLVQVWKSERVTSEFLRYATWREQDARYMKCFLDGSVGKKWLEECDPSHDVAFSISTDGVVLSKKAMSSLWITALKCENFPTWLSSKRDWVFAAIIYPKEAKIKDLNMYYKPLAHQFNTYYDSGFPAYDAITNEVHESRIRLVYEVEDDPGLAKSKNCNVGGRFACPQLCKIPGSACVVDTGGGQMRFLKSTLVYNTFPRAESEFWTHQEVEAAQRELEEHNGNVEHVRGVKGPSPHMQFKGASLGRFSTARYDVSMHGLTNFMKRLYSIMLRRGTFNRLRVMKVEKAARRFWDVLHQDVDDDEEEEEEQDEEGEEEEDQEQDENEDEEEQDDQEEDEAFATSPPPPFYLRNLSTTTISSPSQRLHHHHFTFQTYPPPPFYVPNLSTTTISPSQPLHHHHFTFQTSPPPPFHLGKVSNTTI